MNRIHSSLTFGGGEEGVRFWARDQSIVWHPKRAQFSFHRAQRDREELTTMTQWNADDDHNNKWFPLRYSSPCLSGAVWGQRRMRDEE
jgi:hypothetical protein